MKCSWEALSPSFGEEGSQSLAKHSSSQKNALLQNSREDPSSLTHFQCCPSPVCRIQREARGRGCADGRGHGQALLAAAPLLSARLSQKQTGKAPRQGEGKHLTPCLINSNRHINSRMSTRAVIGNPPVNTLARPNLEAALQRQGGRVCLGAHCSLGSCGQAGCRVLQAQRCGAECWHCKASWLHWWHMSHEGKAISSARQGLQQSLRLL